MSAPIFLDLIGNGRLQAIAASFDGQVHAIDTTTGKTKEMVTNVAAGLVIAKD